MRLVLAALLALALPSCVQLPPAGLPEVLVATLTRSVGDPAGQLQVELLVRNPGPYALPVMGVDFELALAGRPLARGLSNESLLVPASGESRVLVSAVVLENGALEQFRRRLTDGSTYRIDGRLYLGAGRISSIPFALSAPL